MLTLRPLPIYKNKELISLLKHDEFSEQTSIFYERLFDQLCKEYGIFDHIDNINRLENRMISEMKNLKDGTEEEIIKTKRMIYYGLGGKCSTIGINEGSKPHLKHFTKNQNNKIDKIVNICLKSANYYHKADEIVNYYTPIANLQSTAYFLASEMEQIKDPSSPMIKIYNSLGLELSNLVINRGWANFSTSAFYKLVQNL